MNHYRTALLVVILLSALAQRAWITINQVPPQVVDDGDHLVTSYALYQTFSQQGCRAFVRQFFRTASHFFHPLLLPALAAPLYAWFAPTVKTALWINTLLLALLCIYLFKLMKQLTGGDEMRAVVAVTILMLFPMTYGLARLYMLELGVAALVVIWLYYFYRSDGLAERRYLPQLGVWLGCGLLAKATFPMYVAGPMAWSLLNTVRHKKLTVRQAVARLLLVGAIGAVLAGPWYWNNIAAPLGEAVAQLRGDPGDAARDHARTWSALATFGVMVAEEGPSVYFLLLGLAALVLVMMSRRSWRGRGAGFLVAGLVPPVLICAATVPKITRFIFPALPALAGLLSLLLVPLLPASHRRRALVLGGLLLIPLGNFFQLSFTDVWTRLPARVLSMDRLGLLYTGDLEFACRARRASWPLESILAALHRHTTAQPPEPIHATLYVCMRPFFEANFTFLAMTRQIPFQADAEFRCEDPGSTSSCMAQALAERTDSEFVVIEWPVEQRAEIECLFSDYQGDYHKIETFPAPLWWGLETEITVYQKSQRSTDNPPRPPG